MFQLLSVIYIQLTQYIIEWNEKHSKLPVAVIHSWIAGTNDSFFFTKFNVWQIFQIAKMEQSFQISQLLLETCNESSFNLKRKLDLIQKRSKMDTVETSWGNLDLEMIVNDVTLKQRHCEMEDEERDSDMPNVRLSIRCVHTNLIAKDYRCCT